MYCERTNIEAIFGVTNVEQWADLDSDEDVTKMAARIAVAVTTAEADIDDLLRDGPYDVPLVSTGGSMTPTIVDIAARKAGMWLYENRGSQDVDEHGRAVHKFAAMTKRVDKILNQILAGKRSIQCERTEMGTDAPFVSESKKRKKVKKKSDKRNGKSRPSGSSPISGGDST